MSLECALLDDLANQKSKWRTTHKCTMSEKIEKRICKSAGRVKEVEKTKHANAMVVSLGVMRLPLAVEDYDGGEEDHVDHRPIDYGRLAAFLTIDALFPGLDTLIGRTLKL